jgi:bifunctional oligoribonuclease and PAP phosphatase NrnA
MSLQKVVAYVKRNNNFLITTHTNLEGDALGSQISMWCLLRRLGKRASMMNDDAVPYGYDFLPFLDRIERFSHKTAGIKFDCLTILDCSDLRRCGQVSTLPLEGKAILNIDHHISNSRFGHLNWVEPTSSSCSEMIYKLYKALRVPLGRQEALLLYAGIVTDTGSFRYPNTNKFTHQVAADLLNYGLDVSEIYKKVYEDLPLVDAKLLLKILPTIQLSRDGKIAWFQVKRGLFKDRTISCDLGEQLLHFARSIKDVEVALLFKENLKSRGEVRVNFRSRGRVDVNTIAHFFGGGGHKTASGCTIRGDLGIIRGRVVKKVSQFLT